LRVPARGRRLVPQSFFEDGAMLPLYAGVHTATSPKSFLQPARSNVILVTVLLISAIFLTSCGVSGVSAYAPHTNSKASNVRRSESSSTSRSSSTSESSKTVEAQTAGHITVSANLPHATAGKPYNAVVSVSGGMPPYQLSILWGAFPA